VSRRAIRFSGVLVFLAVVLLSCSDRDEETGRVIQRGIDGLEEQVQGMGEGHREIERLAGEMEVALGKMSAELEARQSRLTAARKANMALGRLVAEGLGESPASYVLRNPATGPAVLIVMALLATALLVFYRMRRADLDQAMEQEIDRVIKRLSETTPPRPPPRPGKQEDKNAAVTAKQTPAKDRDEGGRLEESKATPKAKAAAGAPQKTAAKRARSVKNKSAAGPKKASAKKSSAAARKKNALKKPARRTPARKCKVKGCNNKHRSKGFCNKHYQQWRRGTLSEEFED